MVTRPRRRTNVKIVGRAFNWRRMRKSSAVAKAFFKANLQRHITKTVLINAEHGQSWFYNVMYANQAFTLNQLPAGEVAAIQELYDYYRIDGIKLEFYPQWNSASGVNAQPEIGLARLTHAVDSNTFAPPANEGDLLEHRATKSPLFSRVIKKYFKVQPQGQVVGQPGNPGAVTAPDNKRNPWVMTNEAAIPHYGIHFIATTLAGVANESAYRIVATFYMTLKGQR